MVWRAYGFAVALAVAITAVAVVVAIVYDLPFRDPDDAAGPTYLRLGLVIAAAFLTDVVPRCVRRADGVRDLGASFVRVVRERWPRRQVGLVVVGLGSWYLTYVAFRNLKSFVPFVNPGLADDTLAEIDRFITFGNNPAEVLHGLLGTDVAAHFLSAIYIAWIAFVPISLAWALVWSRDLKLGSWYVTAIAIDWALGVATYFAVPSVGPIYHQPGHLPRADRHRSRSVADEHVGRTRRRPRGSVGDPCRADDRRLRVPARRHHGDGLRDRASGGPAGRVRWLLWAFLAVTVLSTVYLGWHYLVDAFGGFALGAAAAVLGALVTGNAGRLRRRSPRRRADGTRCTYPPDAPPRDCCGPSSPADDDRTRRVGEIRGRSTQVAAKGPSWTPTPRSRTTGSSATSRRRPW